MTVIHILMIIVAIPLLICLQFALAPWWATVRRVKQVRILGGIGEYVRWDHGEVVIFSREVEPEISDGQGGSRFIFPLFAQSVRARILMASQSLTWKDKVDIQDALPCNIEITIRWIVDDAKLYFSGKIDEAGAHNAGEKILKELIGHQVMEMVSNANFQVGFTASLFLRKSEFQIEDGTRPGMANITAILRYALLAKLNLAELNKEIHRYGLRLDDVKLQSIKWAPEVHEEILKTLKKRLEPDQARSQADADRIKSDNEAEAYGKMLQEVKNVLGPEVTQIRELLQHLPAGLSLPKEDVIKAIFYAVKGRSSQEIATNPPKREIES